MSHVAPAIRRPLFLAAGCVLALAPSVQAQLHAAAPCAHVKKPIVVLLNVPEKAGPDELAVELINPASGQVIESRPARAGENDLADLFPRLWTTDSPQVLLAQAVIAKERVGAPLVLVPMVAPPYAPKVERDGVPQMNPAPPAKSRVLSGYWVYADQRVQITTSKGTLVFALRPDAARNSVDNFRNLVEKKFYDGIKVHRIAALSGRTMPDIVQFGDPSGTGQGGPGWFIDYEPSPLKHGFGSLSFARTSEPNSAGSQVIVCLGREAAAQLDGKYTVFGQLVSGAETLNAIAKTPVDADGKPREAMTIESAKLVDAPPYGAGPRAETDPYEKPKSR